MKLTNLQRQWRSAASRFNLSVETPFTLRIKDGRSIEAEVLVRGYGAPQGTLVVSDYASIASFRDEIIAAGFTISSYSQPRDEDIDSLEGIEEMLNDWTKIEP
jgi:hypothetical protein